MDKSFFKIWVLRIPHRLRDLLSMVRSWSSISPIFSSLPMSRAYSSSQSLLKIITSFWHTFLEWMNPWSWEAIQGGYPTVISEWLSTHIWHGRNQSSHHDRMAHPLHLTMEGTNSFTMSEWLTKSSVPFGGNLDLENTKLLPEVFKLHSGQWLSHTLAIYSSFIIYWGFTTSLCTISLI